MGNIIPIKDYDKLHPTHQPPVPEAYYTKQEVDSKLATKVSGDTFSDHATDEQIHLPTEGETEGKILTVDSSGYPVWTDDAPQGWVKWGNIGGQIDAQADLMEYVSSKVGAETTRATEVETQLQFNIDEEKTRASSAEASLSQSLNAEVTRATTAEATLQTHIDSEVSRALGAEDTLQDHIDTEEAVRAEADTALGTRVTNEISRATNAEHTLQTNIDTEASTRAAADTAEATSRQQADETLQTNIDNEETRAEEAESTLQTNIESEAATRTDADIQLQTNIDNEASTRGDADTQLQTNIDTEASTRAAADTTLQTNIDNETTRATTAEATKEDLSNKVQVVDQSGTADQYPSARAVYAAIQAIPTGMIYQGTLAHTETIEATVHELPTAEEAHEGWTYKVIEQYEYITGETAEKGDLYVCGWNTETEIHQWKIIPAFEKVKDVQVNGVSVVDSAGFANIIHKFYWCTYSTTTYQQITDALADGKVPICVYNDSTNDTANIFLYSGHTDSGISQYHFSCIDSLTSSQINVLATDQWLIVNLPLQTTRLITDDIASNPTSTTKYPNTKGVVDYAEALTNKTTTVSSTSTDTEYPSAKAVADYWDVQNKFYWCTYGTTTYDEITTAIENGKTPMVVYTGSVLDEDGNEVDSFTNALFTYIDDGNSTSHRFGAVYYTTSASIYITKTDNQWKCSTFDIELTRNKKSTIVGNESSETYYPNTKAVADYWDAQNKFFWCTYGTTTYAEITDAVAAGKTPVCIYHATSEDDDLDAFENQFFTYNGIIDDKHFFSKIYSAVTHTIRVDVNNQWSTGGTSLQDIDYRTDDVASHSTSSAYYPSTKAVADYAVHDVQINGTSITSSGVANISIASESAIGVFRASASTYNADMSDSACLRAKTNTLAQYTARNAQAFIGKGTLENIKDDYVKRGLANSSLEWTEAEQTAARARLDAAQDKFFFCTYSTTGEGTTFEEVTNAIADGKVPVVVFTTNGENKFNNGVFFYNYSDSTTHYFGAVSTAGDIWVGGVNCNTSNIWSKSEQTAENVYYKKSTIVGQESSTITYPNCKAVADYVAAQDKFFLCTYSRTEGGGTTYEEIEAALEAGKTPIVVFTGSVLDEDGNEVNYFTNTLLTYGQTNASLQWHYFGSPTLFMGYSYGMTVQCQKSSTTGLTTWSAGAVGISENSGRRTSTITGRETSTEWYPSTKGVADYAEALTNKTTEITSSSTDTQYPSAKAVADYWDTQNKFYWVTYGTTTGTEIQAALDAGKTPIMIYHKTSDEQGDGESNYYDSMLLTFTTGDSSATGSYSFSGVNSHYGQFIVAFFRNSSQTWSVNIYGGEMTSRRTSTISGEGSTTNYPDTKAVVDYVADQNKFYWCTYGTTEFADITEAIADGKTPVCIYSPASDESSNVFENQLFTFSGVQNGYYLFSALHPTSMQLSALRVNSSGWGRADNYLQLSSFRTDNVETYKTSSAMYPSTKGVADYVAAQNKFYWCTYGSTPFADITAAVAAGKTPALVYKTPSTGETNAWEDQFYLYNGGSSTKHYFACVYETEAFTIIVDSSENWSTNSIGLETSERKRSTITGYETSTTDYPNTKAIADYWTAQNKFYWCTYSATGEGTTYQEISDAIASGKVPVCVYPDSSDENHWANMFYTLSGKNTSGNYVFSGCFDLAIGTLYLNTSNLWTQTGWNVENTSNKKSTIVGYETATAYYPTTKAVADYWTAQNKFYWCTYGTTEFADISQALVDGKIPVLIYWAPGETNDPGEGQLFVHSHWDYYNNTHYFSGIRGGDSISLIAHNDNTWSASSTSLEDSSNKVATITGYETSTSNYPSTKAVADYSAMKDWELVTSYTLTEDSSNFEITLPSAQTHFAVLLYNSGNLVLNTATQGGAFFYCWSTTTSNPAMVSYLASGTGDRKYFLNKVDLINSDLGMWVMEGMSKDAGYGATTTVNNIGINSAVQSTLKLQFNSGSSNPFLTGTTVYVFKTA